MKIFHRKKEAINFINKSNNRYLRLYQQDINDNGSKKFITCESKEIFDIIEKNKRKKRYSNYYESWNKDDKLCFSLDIDIKLKEKEKRKINLNKILETNILNVIKFANKYYNHIIDIDDIIILKTKNQNNKLSAHVIFRGLCFENYLVCRNFYNRMIKEDTCSLKYTDRSIYNLTCFRTCYSTKMGRCSPLKPYKLTINGKNTSMPNDYETKNDYFHQTLITTIDPDEINNMISKDKIKKFNNQVEITNLKTNTNKDEIIKILDFVPYEYCVDFKPWNYIGMILYSIDVNNLDIFDKWSQKCKEKYNKADIIKRWQNFNNPNFNRGLLNINHLKFIAKNGGYKFDKENTEFIVNNYPEVPIKLTDTNLYKVKNINLNKLNQKLFKSVINNKFVAIQSEKGTGKTSNLLPTLFNDNKKAPKSALFISSRRTFGIKLKADLKKYGFQLYSEINEYNIFNKRIICQIDSLLRLQCDKFDVVIIDECESLARYIGSSHFTKNSRSSYIVSELEERVISSKKLIIMDADLSDRCMNYYTGILGSKLNSSNIKVIRNNFTPYQNYKINYMKYESWVNKLLNFIGKNKKLAIPMASNNKAKDLYALLQKYYPDKKIKLIHKETKDEEKLKELLNVNERWIEYDIVIYTPTVCMGVSFDPTYFDNIFAYGCHNSLGAQEFCQMIHRIRNPKDNNIYLGMDHYKFFDKEDDTISYSEVEEMMCNDYYLTKFNLHENLMVKKVKRENNERVLYYPYKNEPIYDLLVRNNIEKIENSNNFASTFFGYIKFKNYQYNYYESEKNSEIISELKLLREERNNEEESTEINNLLNAKTLTEEEYKEKIMRKEQFLTEDDIHEINKFKLMKIYNLKNEQLNEDLIKEYKNKSKIHKYHNLSTIKNYEDQNTDVKIKILKSNESENLNYQNCYQQLTRRNYYVHHNYIITILKKIDLDINNIDNKDNSISLNTISEKLNDEFINYLEVNRMGLYNAFNIKKIKKADFNEYKEIPKKFVQLLNQLLFIQYGIKLKKTNYSKNNEDYYLSTNKLWDNLPHSEIIGRKINDLKIKYKKINNIDDLEIGIDSDSELSDSE